MKIISIEKNDEKFNIFLQKANEAYLERKSEKVPFSPISADDITDQEKIFLVIDNEEIVSGCCVYPLAEKVVRLQHVWTDVHKPRRGYASFLLDEVEEIVKRQGNLEFKLGIMSSYKPAYSLYIKKGWKGYAIVANQPGTCYTVSMVKYLGEKGKKTFELKRMLKFFLSKIKEGFYTLF